MIPTVYFLFPETAGRSLEEIDDFFVDADPTKPWQVIKIAQEMPFRHSGHAADLESTSRGEGVRRRIGKSSGSEKGGDKIASEKTIEHASLSDSTDVE